MTLIRQTSVAEAAKLDFANGIRALMRQDPDVDPGRRDPRPGDRRDGVPRGDDRPPGVLDAAHQLGGRRASRACSTSASCPTSSPATSSASSAQRLVRQAVPHLPAVLRPRRARAAPARRRADRAARRCIARSAASSATTRATAAASRSSSCSRSTPAIDELVARRATAREILTAARAAGFKTLADDGVRLVRAGVTSLDE